MVKPFALLLLAVSLAFPGLGYCQGPLQKVVVTYSSRSIASIDLYIAGGESV